MVGVVVGCSCSCSCFRVLFVLNVLVFGFRKSKKHVFDSFGIGFFDFEKPKNVCFWFPGFLCFVFFFGCRTIKLACSSCFVCLVGFLYFGKQKKTMFPVVFLCSETKNRVVHCSVLFFLFRKKKLKKWTCFPIVWMSSFVFLIPKNFFHCLGVFGFWLSKK